MGFFVKFDASGDVLEASGDIRRDAGRLFGISGVGTCGLDGLVDAYCKEGASFSNSWVGQYAAVVVAEKTLVLAQSSLGLGRAYYAQTEGKLVVGSDLSAVALGVGCTGLDPIFFSRFMAMRPALDRTPYSKVRQLCGGETIVFSNKGKYRLRPWQPTQKAPRGDPLDRLHVLLKDALNTYTAGDSTTMIDISGGTDSTLVAAVAVDMGLNLHAISHIPKRGARGDDCYYARRVASQLNVPLTEIDSDFEGMTTALPDLPDQPGSCSYRETTHRIGDLFRVHESSRHLTGVGGDIVFDFRGLAPAFLADPIVAGRPLAAWRTASAYARERGGHRSASHFLRYVALPIAARHLLGRNIGAPHEFTSPDWLNLDFAQKVGVWRSPLASSVARPSSRFLWELIFDIAAAENRAPQFSPTTQTLHPLLHRPLVEHCLNLAPEVRRGIGSDRALQRTLLRQLGQKEVAERSDKGSAQPQRETHLLEEPPFLDSLMGGELVSRGWVEPLAWRRAVDQIRVGASPFSVRFAAAVECELWLRRAVKDGKVEPTS